MLFFADKFEIRRFVRLAVPSVVTLIVILMVNLMVAVITSRGKAASCCGGGFASPSLITGDERATLSTELSYANILTDVSSRGLWQDRTANESLQTMKVQGAHIFADRFQFGLSAPVVTRQRGSSSATGIGDLGFTFGYEILPEWDYSRWRPRGVSFLTLTAPTGRPIQEANESLQLDARGRGFWAVGLGTTLTKIVGSFDLLTTLEVHRSFAREIKTAMFEGQLKPGFGGLATVAGGYSVGDARLGASLAWSYEDAIESVGLFSSPGSPSRFATGSLTASYMIGEEWAMSITYTDQTLFGAPTNASLARGLSLTAQRRFLR